MSNDYGKNAPLSYNKYLRVRELIDLQTCLSSPAQHVELLFITVHQAYELWFKQILHEIDAAIALMKKDRPTFRADEPGNGHAAAFHALIGVILAVAHGVHMLAAIVLRTAFAHAEQRK